MKRILICLTALTLIGTGTTFGQAMNNTNHVIAFASDTQAPLWIESVFLRDRKNQQATELVFTEVIRKHPLGLFILGDVVSLGYSRSKWVAVDSYIKATRGAGIPVYAVLGNHELMQRPVSGEANFQQRFPEHVRTGYLQIVDSVAVVLLNSNFSSLGKAEVLKQHQWLGDTLKALDDNSAIRAVIVGCHHPPFTNSRLVKSSQAVQEQFVKPFLSSKKCKLFVTGHSHAFEYFKREGKDFLIIGGGGGLHHPLNTGKDCLEDKSASYKPMFHYLTVNIAPDRLLVVSHQLRPDFSGFEEGFSIQLPLEKW